MANQNQGGSQSESGKSGNEGNRQGFAAMDKDELRDVAAEGGRASHEQGTGHEFTSQEAREAGRKGGQASAESRSEQSGASSASTRGESESGGSRSGGNNGGNQGGRDGGSSGNSGTSSTGGRSKN
jgi:hypothetical protein